MAKTSSYKRLPNSIFLAALNANNPSAANPFATMADLFAGTNIPKVQFVNLLPDPTTTINQLYYVTDTVGAKWRKTLYGGTYEPAGLYYSNGVTWYTPDTPFQASQATVDAGTDTEQFVSAKTLTDSVQLAAKANTSGQVFTGVISAPNLSNSNTGDNATNTTSNAYADAKITQTITNGVTTTAPSEDAVFDALALKASIIQAGIASAGTGVLYGGVGSVNGGLGIGNTINVSAGLGQILDNTTSSLSFISVTISLATNVALVNTGVQYTYWYVDSLGVLTQTTTAPTSDTYRTRIWLFRTSYTGGVITGLANIVTPVLNLGATLRDLNYALSMIKANGLVPINSGANLKLKITSGEFYFFGGNTNISPTSPNLVTLPTFDTGISNTFRYATTSGVILSDVTNLVPGSYQVGGVVTTIPGANTRTTIQYILVFQGGLIRVLYGNAFYNSTAEAQSALAVNDPYTCSPPAFSTTNSFVLGAVIMSKNATNLSTQGMFIPTNKFGLFGGGALSFGSGAFALIDLSNVAGTITGATKTKVTYDSRGFITSGADATTSDISEGSNLYLSNTNLATVGHGATLDTSPLDADEVMGLDSANSFSLIRITWTSIKAFLKTYFDTQYEPLSVARNYTTVSLANNTARTPSATRDAMIIITPSLQANIGQTAQCVVQVDNSGGGTFTTIATSTNTNALTVTLGLLGGSSTQLQPITFKVPKTSQYRYILSGTGTATINSHFQLLD